MGHDGTQVECDHCGSDLLVAYLSDGMVYVECDACGASVVTARVAS